LITPPWVSGLHSFGEHTALLLLSTVARSSLRFGFPGGCRFAGWFNVVGIGAGKSVKSVLAPGFEFGFAACIERVTNQDEFGTFKSFETTGCVALRAISPA